MRPRADMESAPTDRQVNNMHGSEGSIPYAPAGRCEHRPLQDGVCINPSTMRPRKRPRANNVRPYRMCTLICRGRRPRRPAMPISVTRLSHNFPTFFKFSSFSFHIRRVYCKCSQEGSRDPERERDPKFFHPYSSFLLTPGRCRKIPAPLWCFFGTICRFLVQRLQFDRIYIIIETLPIVAKNRIIS